MGVNCERNIWVSSMWIPIGFAIFMMRAYPPSYLWLALRFGLWLSFLFSLWFLWDHRRALLPGMACWGVGLGLNTIVMWANGARMPVAGLETATGRWVPFSSGQSWLIFADRFWGASLGDFIMLAGASFVLLAIWGQWSLKSRTGA